MPLSQSAAAWFTTNSHERRTNLAPDAISSVLIGQRFPGRAGVVRRGHERGSGKFVSIVSIVLYSCWNNYTVMFVLHHILTNTPYYEGRTVVLHHKYYALYLIIIVNTEYNDKIS